MSHLTPANTLSEYRRVTVIVRLVLDDRGRISYGEFIDVDTAQAEGFAGWRGLLRIASDWLTRQRQDRAVLRQPSASNDFNGVAGPEYE